MKNSTYWKGSFAFVSLLLFSTLKLSAQSVSASPPNILKPIGANTVPVTISPSGFGGSGNYTWTINGGATATGVTAFNTTTTAGTPSQTVNFTSAASGNYTFVVTRNGVSRNVIVTICNLVASVSNDSTDGNKGQWAGGFLANVGILNPVADGQKNFFDFNLTQRVSAIAVNSAGFIYYIENIADNNGSVTVTASNANGTTRGTVATADLNGAGNGTDLGFVRLGIDVTGVGWILASDGSSVYLAKFTTNGTNASAITIVSTSVAFNANSGDASLFQNGDLAFTADGTMFVLANDGATTPTSTAIYTLNPNAVTPTLARKFFIVNNAASPFTGTVNGAAFDLTGNLYISSADGLYFINQNTVNNGSGTVTAILTHSIAGLTDLGSNVWPENSSLPLQLISFAGTFNNLSTKLNWVTENIQNFNRFEIERSTDGRTFTKIGMTQPLGNGTLKAQYFYSDDLSSVIGIVFYYRLKMVDADGQFKYSNVILVKKEQKNLTNIVITPNPVISGTTATVRFTALAKANVELNIIDISGKIVLKQQNNVFEGINSVPVNKLERLQPGTYVLQVKDAGTTMTTKFTVVR